MKTGILYGVGVGPGDPELLTLKPVLEIEMPMTRDRSLREKAWAEGAATLREPLDQGKTVVFLTLGDPSVYSTFGYLSRLLQEHRYDARMIAGVPSFCAAAATLGISLCEDREELHLIPGSAEDLSAALNYTGTKVFMKGNLPVLLNTLEKEGYQALGAQNCGTKDEALYRSLEEIPGDAGYYTVVIAKENDQ